MKKFEVTITETLKKKVEVEAETQEEAEQIVNDEWYKGDHILDADCFTGVVFEAKENEPEKITVSAHKYAVFKTSCCESPDDEWVSLMKKIVSEWLPTTEYKISEHPQINKLFFNDDFSERYMEIWLPIEER